MNKKRELLKNTIIISIGKMSTQIITFLLLPLYTSKLTTNEYGTYDLLITISIFILPLITGLLEESMFRFLIDVKNPKDKDKVITQTIIGILISTVIFSIFSTLMLFITKYNYGFIFILYIISCIFINVINALMRGLGNFKLYSFSNFVIGTIVLTLNLLFILVFKMGINSLLIASICANIGVSLYIFFRLKIYRFINIKEFDIKYLREMVKYSAPLIPNSISWNIIHLSDRIIISKFLGNTYNGIYAVAGKFPNVVSATYNYFSTAWKENASKAILEEDGSEYFNEILKIVKNIMSSISILLIVFMPLLFKILIKQNYAEAYKYIPFLIISTYFSTIAEFYGGIFVAFKETKIIGRTTVVGACINLIIDLILIKFIGIYAAVLSTIISNIYMMLKRRHEIKKYINVVEHIKFNTLLCLFAIIILYYVKTVYTDLAMIIVALVYIYMSYRKYINNFLQNIKKKRIE